MFYAGHGIEMDGTNYVVPVDARLERDVDVRYETVTLDDLLVATAGASLRLVLLDACRNNPLARSMQRTAATRTVSGGSFGDLNEDLLGDETLVAYAAAAGTTAADGRGRNSPYTAALLAHLETPLEIGLLFRRVRAQVLEATDGEQRPHEYHSLVSEHYLTRPLSASASVTVNAAAPAVPAPAPADPPRPDPAETDVTVLPVAALRERAEAGDAAAQTELGERYEHARGVEQDYGVAVSWFRRAADQGHAPGQAALGFLYLGGLGVPQDDAEGVPVDPPCGRAGACRQPEQPRQDVRDRPGRTPGPRRSCPLVPSGSPAGERTGTGEPRPSSLMNCCADVGSGAGRDAAGPGDRPAVPVRTAGFGGSDASRTPSRDEVGEVVVEQGDGVRDVADRVAPVLAAPGVAVVLEEVDENGLGEVQTVVQEPAAAPGAVGAALGLGVHPAPARARLDRQVDPAAEQLPSLAGAPHPFPIGEALAQAP